MPHADANVGQGGLGLPDRDYYLLDDPKSQETRQKIFGACGQNVCPAWRRRSGRETEAQTVMDISTAWLRLLLSMREDARPKKPRPQDESDRAHFTGSQFFEFDKFFSSTGAPSIYGSECRTA